MRRYLLTVVIGCCVLLFACKKDKSAEPGGGGNAAGGLLTKTVTKQGNDSISVAYGYDNQKRISSYSATGAISGTATTFDLKITRNGQGVIQRMVQKSNILTSIGIDSVVQTVYYDAARSRYTASANRYVSSLGEFRDSTSFTYNNAGRITGQEYFFDDGTTGGYIESEKTEYTYDANGNITREKMFVYDETTGTYDAYLETAYEYDTKVNPLNIGAEAFLLGDLSLASKNNRTKVTSTDLTDPDNNDVTTITYVYNTSDKPASAVLASSTGGNVQVTYTYQ
ncbi:MAG TPA: hypothetical protein VEZ55_09300 [Chitinophagaceae bacterium]|nr:hypothetical protein [Chitinophagaceae bacterium]